MIYDSMDNLKAYKGLNANLDDAIDWLAAADLESLSEGKHEVDGTRIFALAQAYRTKDPAAARYEAHRKYIDIQLILAGKENCWCLPAADLKAAEPFAEDKDIGFFAEPGAPGACAPLVPGRFAVFFPPDAHKPSCELGGAMDVRKIVVKVAL